jgi:hypothetical protein
MATETSPSSEVSVTGLLTGILADAQDLALRHLALLRSEVKESLRETRQAMILMGLGVMLLQLGMIFLCQMCVVLLTHLVPALPVWGSYAIVGGVLVLCGAGPLLAGISRLKTLDLTHHSSPDSSGGNRP